MTETIREGKAIFCNWVGLEVHENFLGKNCCEWWKDDVCNHCSRSEQLELGMSSSDLLRNLQSCQ